MKIKEIKLGLIYIVSLSGPFVRDQLAPLVDVLDRTLAAGNSRVLIDLKEVPLIDSAGLELLWDTHIKFRKEGGMVKLAYPNPLVMDIFHATKATNTFEIFQDQEKAYRSFR
ncbi:MAG: STAS domain-containing protein [Deltaproteobacteria bacterium]|nr:STAS domain-containing protein [Deltaproteobacteria bacterium]